MEGLRSVAAKYKKHAKLWVFSNVPNNTASVYQIWPTMDGLGAPDDFHAKSIEDTALMEFLKRGTQAVSPYEPVPALSNAGVKIVFFGTFRHYRNNKRFHIDGIKMPQAIFESLVETLNPDPLSVSMFSGFYPLFEYSGGFADGDIAAVHFRTRETRFMWSIRQHEKSSSFDTRCIAIMGHGYQPISPPSRGERRTLLECLEAFKQDIHSPLYFPFVVSVHTFHFIRIHLDALVEEYLSSIERTYDTGRSIINFHNEYIVPDLGRSLLAIRATIDSIESLYDYLENMAKELPPSARSEKVVQSTDSILSAIQFQRKALKSLREGLHFAERRSSNEASLRALNLSSSDSKINIKTAVASRDLAGAARRDSSAMKSIAVLTMAFLPGTFFAALFSMPSLGWDQPRHFVLYWAYVIPFTLVTFIIWAIFSQRYELRQWAKGNSILLPLLPMWYLAPKKRQRDDMDEDSELEDVIANGWEEHKKRKKFEKRRREAKEQLKDRIDKWKPW